jgi:NAD(P)-dependent dehydrogenase (short-subunit alcohol dehydrogenase family)
MHTLVMTGATRGIGRVAVERLLREDPDARLVVVARDPGSVRLGSRVTVVGADLAALSSVRAAAERIAALLDEGDLPPLRGFVGNAGVQHTDALTSGPDGLEVTFTVNVLANHLFLRVLRDRFTVPARVVITVSDTHFGDFRHNLGMVPAPVWQHPDVLAEPGAFTAPGTAVAGRAAYATSKLAAIHLVHEHARRSLAGVDVLSFNPGFVPGTDLALPRDAGPLARFAVRHLLLPLTWTPVATSRSVAGRHLADLVLGRVTAPTGSYVDRARLVPSSPESYDESREADLWKTADRLCGI